MSQFDKIVFGKKTFANILEEIYDNQKKKDKQVTALIGELKPMIEEIGDATLIVPLIKEYINIVDVDVIKNTLNLGQPNTNKKRRKKS